MKILGIITEYNPYHLGHRLHLQEAKKLIKPNLTICVMSSSFVQRGEPAMISYQKSRNRDRRRHRYRYRTSSCLCLSECRLFCERCRNITP